MNCLHCQSTNIYQCLSTTNLGYKEYRCRSCKKQYNEGTGTAYNFLEYPTDVVVLVLFHYIRFKLRLDDVVELMAMRGFHMSHQTVHNWVQTIGVNISIKYRKLRYKKCTDQWHVDATYLKSEGRWC